MDKYKKLISNTVVFAVGSFSSKLLGFIMLPFFTAILLPEQFNSADLIVQTANLIIPIASAGMGNALIRFGLDKTFNKASVFTNGILAVTVGYGLFLLLYPLLRMLPQIESHTYLIYFFVLTSCMRSLCTNFARARELVRLYAFDGVLSTITFVLFNLLFLLVFKMGVTGYVMATICSDFMSALFIFAVAGLGKYVRFSKLDSNLMGSMLRYALPLIPTTVFWWITNVSDRYLVAYMVGPAVNGLYGISYRIPNMINVLSGFFTDAWQMSAITADKQGREKFFTNVFSAYQALIFTAASGLLMLCRPITSILASEAYYDAWRYIPFLVVATSFSCFVSFLGSIYMLKKKSVLTLVTTMAGAILNIILNLILIPFFGANGAAFSTFISFFTVFMLRVIDTRRFVRFQWSPAKMICNLALLLGQCALLLNFEENWLPAQMVMFFLVLLLNLKLVLKNIRRMLARRSR